MTAPSPDIQARLDGYKAREPAEESAVERVARAIFDAANPIVESFPDYWERVAGGHETRQHYRRLAQAAIDSLKGRDEAGEAVARVLGLAESLEAQGNGWRAVMARNPWPSAMAAAIRDAVSGPVPS